MSDPDGEPSGVVQTGNEAGGHLGARDVNAVTIEGDLNINPPQMRGESTLARLYKRLRDEVADDQQLTEYIDHLKIFTRVVEDESIVGLEGKLDAAKRTDQLDMAMAMKEMVYSELRANMFSETFQTIYATLMAKIHEDFETWVRPAIVDGESRATIDQLISERVIKPVVLELDECSEYDGVAIPTVRGMLYFLTGNCHLVWH